MTDEGKRENDREVKLSKAKERERERERERDDEDVSSIEVFERICEGFA